MKKWLQGLVAGLLVLGIVNPAWAASSGKMRIGTSGTSSHSIGSSSSSTGGQRPSSSVTNSQIGNTNTEGKTYNSGLQRPSSSVTQQPSSTIPSQPTTTPSNIPTSKPRSGLGSFLGGMAVGGLLGSMFHPFGGGMHTTGLGGFSFVGLFLDIIIIAAIVWVIRRFWRRA